MNEKRFLPDGWSWPHALIMAIISIVMLIGIVRLVLGDLRDGRYVLSGVEESYKRLSVSLTRAGQIDDPVARLQSRAFVSRLERCVSSRVARSMKTVAKQKTYRGMDRESIVSAVADLQQQCAVRLLEEVALSNPTAALALASELQGQGFDWIAMTKNNQVPAVLEEVARANTNAHDPSTRP